MMCLISVPQAFRMALSNLSSIIYRIYKGSERTDRNGSQLPRKDPKQEKTLWDTYACYHFIISCLDIVPQIKRPAGKPSALISCVVNSMNILDAPFHNQLEQREMKVAGYVNAGYFTPSFPCWLIVNTPKRICKSIFAVYSLFNL